MYSTAWMMKVSTDATSSKELAFWVRRLGIDPLGDEARESGISKYDVYIIQNSHRIEFHGECAGGVGAAMRAYASLAASVGRHTEEEGASRMSRPRVEAPLFFRVVAINTLYS